MGELLATPWKRLLLAAAGVALALVLPAGRFGTTGSFDTAVRAVPPSSTELGGLFAALDGLGDPARSDPAAGDLGAALAASLENLGAASASDDDAAEGAATAEAATGGEATDDGTTTPGGLGAVLAASLENVGATGGDEPAGTTATGSNDLGAVIAATLASSDADEGSARAIAAWFASPTLRTTEFGRYLVVAAGLLGWAASRLRAGLPAKVLTVAGAALVGYVVLRLLTAEITTTLLVLIVSFALAISTVVTIALPRTVVRGSVRGRAT